ncbi:glyoxalase/bleomycin resistance protein/dioxygenase superfamily protein [Fictibacillus macauensis ZFHKF-1]|uniref:Glyoxalase/bleomycin resistance protein/dioxygenase superfamily protein n=1 Tax=Fictibacillus macauensis ZFHKF-1 TaxID=1196324 RepID=I8AH26_9BACL|nr:VOC family protein [Fictibacillus macauensis]EIT84967.1 glyoxalase/bleomycin resistance protein/dioxygenase superfamily protein [Fictibacillus macauensis ZFHKF-1]
MIIGFHHIQLCIPIGEEERARAFYSTILQFTEIEKPAALRKNGGLWYKVGEAELHIGTEQPLPKGKGHPAFKVTDLSEWRALLEKANIAITEEIQIPGFERFSFYDPFNNRIEMIEALET